MISSGNPDYRCKDCRRATELFMLIDTLWLELADHKRDTLCIRCCEVRLERDLTVDDFKPSVLCNRLLFLGYALGRNK